MEHSDPDGITRAVLARLADTPDARLKEIMTGLVTHLNAFAREVKLTEAEWFKGIELEGARHYEHGQDVGSATIEVWQADAEGKYDVQREGLKEHRARGVLQSGPRGEFHFRTILAQPYPMPDDGPVGDMLRATARHPWRPAHLHFMIVAPGYETLITHVFRRGDPYLETDAVFGVLPALLADWVKQADDGYRVEYDFVLNPISPGRTQR